MRQSCTIETVEERTLMSAAIMSQHPALCMPMSSPARIVFQSEGPSSGPQGGVSAGPSRNVVPAAVTGVSATKSGADSVTLNWNAVASNVDTIVVDYSTDGQTFVTLAMLDSSDTSFTAEELAAGQTYSFKLWAMNGTGTSPASSTVIASL